MRAGARVSFFLLKPQNTFDPGVPDFSHAITPPAPSVTILATRLILPQASPTQSSIPNGAAIAGGIAAAIAITTIAAFRYFRRRWRGYEGAVYRVIADPEPNEASDLKAVNAQPEPSNDGIKESSDEEALGLSTMPDLPATPMGIYDIRHSVPCCVCACSFLFLGS